MSIRPFVWLTALVAAMGLAGTANAQRFQPFIDPGYFPTDFQLFAPAEVGDFGGEEPPNTGVYFDYDRLYINVSRPDNDSSIQSEFDGDFTWGNRWELGYMTDDHTGWQAVVMHMSGPNEYASFIQLRVNEFNDDDDPVGGAPAPVIFERNPRQYEVRQSLNVASFSSFEFNKTWRRKQFHNGSILEPIVGFRYMNFRNFQRRDSYGRFAEDITGQPVFGVPLFGGPYERFIEDLDIYENDMIGGQIGGRWFHTRGHWTLSTDVRFFAVQNFQTLRHTTLTELTRSTNNVNGDLEGDDVELTFHFRTDDHDQAQEFVWGGEVRAEAAYELTREICLRFGMVFLDLGQGIGRSDSIDDNNEDVVMAGVTFGVTINR